MDLNRLLQRPIALNRFAVGLFAGGQVAEDEGQFVRRFLDRRQPQLLAVYLELHVSGAGRIRDLPQNIENWNLLRIWHEARPYPVVLAYREVIEAREFLS